MKIALNRNPATVHSIFSAISAGIIASLASTILFTVARITDLTSYNPEFLFVAKFWTGSARTPTVWLLGLFLSLIVGGIVGGFYSWGFQAIRKQARSGWDTGIGLGAVHWLIAGRGMGYFRIEWGWPTLSLIFLSHLLFGAIVGGLYLPPFQASGLARVEDSVNGEEVEISIRKAS
jgi:hypothetical protein